MHLPGEPIASTESQWFPLLIHPPPHTTSPLGSGFLSLAFPRYLHLNEQKSKLAKQAAKNGKLLTSSINLLIPLEMLGFPLRVIISFSSQLRLHYLIHFLERRIGVLLILEFSILSSLLSLEFTFSDVYLIYLSGYTTCFSSTTDTIPNSTFPAILNCILLLHYWFWWKIFTI